MCTLPCTRKGASCSKLGIQGKPAFRIASYFRAHGVGIQETTPIPGADRFFIHDPDGNRIELIQWQRPYSSEENAPGREQG